MSGNDHGHALLWIGLLAGIWLGGLASSGVTKHEKRLRVIEQQLEIAVPKELKVELNDDAETEDKQ